MKKNKSYYHIFFMILVSMLFLSGFMGEKALASSSVNYTVKRDDRSRSYHNGKTRAKVYFDIIVLKGRTKAIKAINNDILRECKKFYRDQFDLDCAYSWAESEQYLQLFSTNESFCFTKAKVTYNKNNILSIKMHKSVTGGGIVYNKTYGLNYNLKTGKKLTLTDVCKDNATLIKSNVIKAIIKDGEKSENTKISDYYWDKIGVYKTKKMNFYLKEGNKAVVCFEPYEITFGSWTRAFTIKSKYK